MNPLLLLGITTAFLSILSFMKTEFIYFIFSFHRFKENKTIEDRYFYLLGKVFAILAVIYFVVTPFYQSIPEYLSNPLIFMFVVGKIIFADIPIKREFNKHLENGYEDSI